jgi:protein-arginine kinase activator protein McsA
MRICRNGHLIGENDEKIKSDGHTECGVCARNSMRLWKQRNKARNMEHQLKYQKNNIEKNKAHDAVAKALIRGDLVKPLDCERCNRKKRLHAHHPNYTKRLEVSWLCADCHKFVHKALRTAFGIEKGE